MELSSEQKNRKPDLATLAKHGADLEQVAEMTEAEETVAAYRIFQLRLFAISLKQLGQPLESEAAMQKALTEESEFTYPRAYLESLLKELVKFESQPSA